MSAETIIACTIGAFIGCVLAFALFGIIERHYRKKTTATAVRLRDRDGQYMSRSMEQKRHQVHENLRRELAR